MDNNLRIYTHKNLVILFLMVLALFALSETTFADNMNYIPYDFELIGLTMFIPDTYEYVVSKEDVNEEDIIKELKTIMFVKDTGGSIISLDYVVYIEGIFPYGYLNIQSELIDLANMYFGYGFDLEQLSPVMIYNELKRDSGYIMFDTLVEGIPAIMIAGCALGNDYYLTILFFIGYEYFFLT